MTENPWRCLVCQTHKCFITNSLVCGVVVKHLVWTERLFVCFFFDTNAMNKKKDVSKLLNTKSFWETYGCKGTNVFFLDCIYKYLMSRG